MVDKNDALLREVDEELRREQMEKLWERYGVYLLAAAALIVATVGGYKFWQSRQLTLAETSGAQYEAALNLIKTGKTEDAQKALDAIAAGGHKGYGALAQLQLAGTNLKTGKPKQALTIFEGLATGGTNDTALKSFAALQAAALRLGEADFTEMQNRLNDLSSGTSAWRIPARELLGTAAFKAGNFQEARSNLASLLAEPGAPAGTLERVRVILSAIAAVELAKSPPATATPPAATTPAAPQPAPTAPAAPAAPPK